MSCRIAQADGRIQIKPVDKGGGMAVMNVKDYFIPVGISEKGLVIACSPRWYMTWFFRLSQIFNKIAKSRKT